MIKEWLFFAWYVITKPFSDFAYLLYRTIKSMLTFRVWLMTLPILMGAVYVYGDPKHLTALIVMHWAIYILNEYHKGDWRYALRKQKGYKLKNK